MASTATIRYAGGTRRQYERGCRHGLVILTSVVLATPGFSDLLGGIAVISRSTVFGTNARYVVGNLRTWGWVMDAAVLCALCGDESRQRPGVTRPA